ncbi:MAG: hypothetical protein ACRDL7_11405 [Gaiellaceae bacterium]
MGDQWAKIQSAIGASSKVFELLRRIPKINDAERPASQVLPSASDSEEMVGASINGEESKVGGMMQADAQPVISMKNLTIVYEGTDSPALNNITLDVL